MTALATTEMSADQLARAAVALTYADNPTYVVNMLAGFFDLSHGQWVALRELAKLEVERRAA